MYTKISTRNNQIFMHFFTEKNITKLEKYLKIKETPGKYEIALWEKVAHYTPYFSKIPGVLAICVGNSLSMNAAHKDSDIDLFIITKENRLWIARACITMMLILLRQRKTHKNHAGKFCLSFFITENALNFENIALKNDIYLAYWILTLRPIINRKSSFEVFQNKNHNWIYNKNPDKAKAPNKIITVPENKFLTILWDVCEKILKFIFLPKTKKSFQKLWKPFGVIVSDDILKFHDKDRRKEITNKIF